MVGEDEDSDDENAFNKKSVWARISVVIAGPLFNFILAFFFSLFIVGSVGYDAPEIWMITPDAVSRSRISSVSSIRFGIPPRNRIPAFSVRSHLQRLF